MTTTEISKAIIKVMDEVNWVAKNMTVWTGSSSYKWVSDKDVKQAIRESMIKNGLSILPTDVQSKIQIDRWEEDDTYNKTAPYPKKTKQSIFTEVTTKYVLVHTSWESVEMAWYGQWVDTQDKGAWKATTYALKNTLLNMFLIPTGVDTDDTHSDEYDVPKKTEKSQQYEPEKFKKWDSDIKWYNDTEKNLESWRSLIIDWKTTPQQIISKIESEGFKINNKNKDLILNLF